jgi:mannose-6-phosphate isomerase-like protein (cupin superfamily)
MAPVVISLPQDPGDYTAVFEPRFQQRRIVPVGITLYGVTTEWHRVRDIDERYVIVRGTGKVEVGDLLAAVVSEGDVVRIPANMPQRITNVGDDDLVFFAVCSPRFVQGAYVSGRGSRVALRLDDWKIS